MPALRDKDVETLKAICATDLTIDMVGGAEMTNFEVSEGKIVRIRCYCFCPDTLKTVAEDLRIASLARPYRSPG